jgi:uncharacterized Fe-S center protein
MEADAVVNCANFQPHGVLGFSGAVKNMFNAVVGKCQGHLHELFPTPEDLARVIVDVCAIVKPTISFLDLTTVRDPLSDGPLHPVGVLLSSYDPVALDAVAVHAIGHDKSVMPTINAGEKHGLGIADLKRIYLSGLNWSDLISVFPHQEITGDSRPENLYDKTTRLINKTVLRPRPKIVSDKCNSCGECQRICPVDAIFSASGKIFGIKMLACADCHYCITACEQEAISLQHVGIGKLVRKLINRPITIE